jgi:hypothetical protein
LDELIATMDSKTDEKRAVEIEKREDASSSSDVASAKLTEKRRTTSTGARLSLNEENVNAKLANPLAGIPQDQLLADAESFAKQRGLGHLVEEFKKGALVAQDPTGFEQIEYLDEEDKEALRRELTHRWDQPVQLYWLVVMCSVAAAVQGVRAHDRLL